MTDLIGQFQRRGKFDAVCYKDWVILAQGPDAKKLKHDILIYTGIDKSQSQKKGQGTNLIGQFQCILKFCAEISLLGSGPGLNTPPKNLIKTDIE